MASKNVVEEVDDFLIVMSNLSNINKYIRDSASEKFKAYITKRRGVIIPLSFLSKYSSKEYTLLFFQKNLDNKIDAFGLNDEGALGLETSSMIRSRIYDVMGFMEEMDYNEIYSRAGKSDSLRKSYSINELVEETQKSIPVCNISTLKQIFGGVKPNSMREIWVDIKTGEFYPKQDFNCSFRQVFFCNKKTGIKLNSSYYPIEKFAYETFPEYQAYSNFCKTIKLISKKQD